MKIFKIIILLTSFIGIYGYGYNKSEETTRLKVIKYIELLKANKYDSKELPTFTYLDIPELLEYRNDTQMITNYPHNMLSSFMYDECSLGMYVLWTIESIRVVAIESKDLTGRFPSQNPILQKREGAFEVLDEIQFHKIAATAYYDWWEASKNGSFDEFKSIDPLIETEYRWH